MCVTNTTQRRPQVVAFPTACVGTASTSIISQRLINTFPVPGVASNGAVPTSTYAENAPQEKTRPKRRRKPQKPGKTAKQNERHFVVHNYHDHAFDFDKCDQVVVQQEDPNQRRRGGVSLPFPVKLHAVLEQVEADGFGHVVSWMPHGRSFVIHDSKEFVDRIMPTYFRQSKLTSFQRQLNLYGYCRLTRGADAGGYYHELFLRGKSFLCKQMVRTKVKGTRFKAASSPEQEPDFYTMPPVVVSPINTSDEDMSHGSEQSLDTLSQMYPLTVTSVFEPLPLQYDSAATPVASYEAIAPAPTNSLSLLDPQSLNDADRILDEAVNELFLTETGENDSLADFVHDWDPTDLSCTSFGASLQDDIQLGFMLEKLLED